MALEQLLTTFVNSWKEEIHVPITTTTAINPKEFSPLHGTQRHNPHDTHDTVRKWRPLKTYPSKRKMQ